MRSVGTGEVSGVTPAVGRAGRALLRRVRDPGCRVPADVPRVGRGGRGRTPTEKEAQKEYGRGGRH